MIFNHKYSTTIGLEVHIQLSTKTKAFCACLNEYGAEPNFHTCPVCLGHPGTLPLLNEKVVDFAIKLGLATNCTIEKFSQFVRKNYFYYDLPRGFQITQYDNPICCNGYLVLNKNSNKKIRIKSIQIEEDTAKSIQKDDKILLDYNRAGVPLLEIVTYPDFNSSGEVTEFLKTLQQIAIYLNISKANMEEGSFRCDVNISVTNSESHTSGEKIEIKNLNSINNIINAIEYETNRQISLLENNQIVSSETRFWSEKLFKTISLRNKEQIEDYRYFVEPDLGSIILEDTKLEQLKLSMPKLPDEVKNDLINKYHLSEYQSELLVANCDLLNFFLHCTKKVNEKSPQIYKFLANVIINDIVAYLNKRNIIISDINIELADLIQLIDLEIKGRIIHGDVKKHLTYLLENGKINYDILTKLAANEEDLEFLVERTIKENLNAVLKFQKGKKRALDFLIKKVLDETKNSANPKKIKQILIKKIETLNN